MSVIKERDLCEQLTQKHLLLLLDAERAEVERLNNNNAQLADDKYAALALVTRLEARITQLEALFDTSGPPAAATGIAISG